MPPKGRRATVAERAEVQPDDVQHETAPGEQEPAEAAPAEVQLDPDHDPDADAELDADRERDEADGDEADDDDPAELPFISAGVQSDLDMRGWAGDPATGGTFRKDKETGKVTYTPRR